MNSADEWAELFGEWGEGADGEPLALSVETYLGPGANGPKLAPPESIPGLIQFAQNRLVRNSESNEILSTAAVFGPLELAPKFRLHSRVTLADGRRTTVASVTTANNVELLSFLRVDLE